MSSADNYGYVDSWGIHTVELDQYASTSNLYLQIASTSNVLQTQITTNSNVLATRITNTSNQLQAQILGISQYNNNNFYGVYSSNLYISGSNNIFQNISACNVTLSNNNITNFTTQALSNVVVSCSNLYNTNYFGSGNITVLQYASFSNAIVTNLSTSNMTASNMTATNVTSSNTNVLSGVFTNYTTNSAYMTYQPKCTYDATSVSFFFDPASTPTNSYNVLSFSLTNNSYLLFSFSNQYGAIENRSLQLVV